MNDNETRELAELVERVRNKDNDAWAKLYSKTLPRAMYVATSFLKNNEDAEDVVQDAYVSVWNHIDSLEDATKFQAWLDRIVANRCKNRLKKQDPVLFSDMTICDEEGEESEPEFENKDISFMPAENLDIKETQRIVGEVISSLPVDQKMTVMLFYMDENSIADIAETMGCSEGTVKSRLNRAREAIKTKILAIEKRDGIKLAGIPLAVLLTMFFKNDVVAYAATYSITAAAVGGGAAAVGTTTAATATGASTATGTAATATSGTAAGVSAGASAVGTATATGSAAAGATMATGAAAKAAGVAAKAVGTKIAIGALALAVAGGGTAAVVNNTNRSVNVQIQQESEFAEAEAYFSELYEFVDCNDFRDYKKIAELVRNSNEHNIYPGRQMEYKKEAYDGEKAVKSLTGKGVCFIDSKTVYIGELLNGVPNGKGILVLTVNEKYVDFSYGNWENGALSGEGITGKCRSTTLGYQGGLYKAYTADIYEGEFANDKMNGHVTINSELYTPEINYHTKEIFSTDAIDGRYIINKKWIYRTRNGNGSDYYLCGDRAVNLDKIDKLVLYNQCAWDSTIAKSGDYIRAYEPDPRFEGEKKPDFTMPDIFGIREYSMICDLLDIDIQKEIENSDTQAFTDTGEGIENGDTKSFTDAEVKTLASSPISNERVLNRKLKDDSYNYLIMPIFDTLYSCYADDQGKKHIIGCEVTCEDMPLENKYESAKFAGDAKKAYERKSCITSEEVKDTMDWLFGEGTAEKAENEGIVISGLESRGDRGEGPYPRIGKVRYESGYAVISGDIMNPWNDEICGAYELWLRPVAREDPAQIVSGYMFEKFVIYGEDAPEEKKVDELQIENLLMPSLDLLINMGPFLNHYDYVPGEVFSEDISANTKYYLAKRALENKKALESTNDFVSITPKEVKKTMDALFGEDTAEQAEKQGINIEGGSTGKKKDYDSQHLLVRKWDFVEEDGYGIIKGKLYDDYYLRDGYAYELWLKSVSEEDGQIVPGYMFEKMVLIDER